MTTEKYHRTLLVFVLLICVFLYLDTYLIGVKRNSEVVEETKYFHQRSRRSTSRTYVIKTNADRFDVTGIFYNAIDKGDTVIVERSSLTGAVSNVLIGREGICYSFPVGFMNGRTGYIWNPLLAIITIGFLLLYHKVSYLPGRTNLTFALFISGLLMLFYYLGWYPS